MPKDVMADVVSGQKGKKNDTDISEGIVEYGLL